MLDILPETPGPLILDVRQNGAGPELLTHWQPWLPHLTCADMAAHIPALAEAITVLVARGQVELFFGEPDGPMGLVSSADVPNIVMDANNWCSSIEGTTPQTELLLSPEAGLVPLPQRRPRATDAQE
jgi:hypothetical protein